MYKRKYNRIRYSKNVFRNVEREREKKKTNNNYGMLKRYILFVRMFQPPFRSIRKTIFYTVLVKFFVVSPGWVFSGSVCLLPAFPKLYENNLHRREKHQHSERVWRKSFRGVFTDRKKRLQTTEKKQKNAGSVSIFYGFIAPLRNYNFKYNLYGLK